MNIFIFLALLLLLHILTGIYLIFCNSFLILFKFSVHVVFGHVISGHDIVLLISNHSVDKHSRPTSEIKIANCGELVPQIKQKEKSDSKSKREQSSDEDSSDSDSSSSDSDSSSSDSSNSNSSLPPEKSENGKTTLNAENVDENGKNDNDNVDNNEDYDFPF